MAVPAFHIGGGAHNELLVGGAALTVEVEVGTESDLLQTVAVTHESNEAIVGNTGIGVGIAVCVGGIEAGQVQLLQTGTAAEHFAEIVALGGVSVFQTLDLFQRGADLEDLSKDGNITGVKHGHINGFQGSTVIEQCIQVVQLGSLPTGKVDALQTVAVGKHMAHIYQIGNIPAAHIRTEKLTATIEHTVGCRTLCRSPVFQTFDFLPIHRQNALKWSNACFEARRWLAVPDCPDGFAATHGYWNERSQTVVGN